MLLDPRHVVPSTRSSKLKPDTFKIIALMTLAGLALVLLVSNKVEAPGELEYPTMFYGP
jgi:hypothetical protein